MCLLSELILDGRLSGQRTISPVHKRVPVQEIVTLLASSISALQNCIAEENRLASGFSKAILDTTQDLLAVRAIAPTEHHGLVVTLWKKDRII